MTSQLSGFMWVCLPAGIRAWVMLFHGKKTLLHVLSSDP